MRKIFVLLAGASLFACSDQTPAGSEADTGQTATAALAFEGAMATEANARIAHGERLSHVLGCKGCHRVNLEGGNMGDFEPPLDGIYASNLTTELPKMDDAELRLLLRKGVHPTRGDMWLMPSGVINRLSDPDMDALIAYLRTVPPSGEPTPPTEIKPAAQAMVEAGALTTSSEQVKQFNAAEMDDLGEARAWGRYLTATTCAECHGPALEGSPDFAPNLDIAGAYSIAELRRLLTEGVGKDGRDLGLMSLVGVEHFSYLTDRERDAIIAYVKERADRNVAQ